VRRHGKNVGENIGNPLGTWKEHSANTLGSQENEKKSVYDAYCLETHAQNTEIRSPRIDYWSQLPTSQVHHHLNKTCLQNILECTYHCNVTLDLSRPSFNESRIPNVEIILFWSARNAISTYTSAIFLIICM
jgi:hypothetical protein